MVAGFDKYYQIARCFRDEGMRADRQPEFTQLDMEMAFAGQEQVMETMEAAVKTLWKEAKGIDLNGPFPRLTYDEAIKFYGSDKPDLRFQGKIAFSIQDSNHVIEGLLLKGRGRNSLNRHDSFEFCLPVEGIKSKEVIKAFEKGKESIWKWHGNKISDCPHLSQDEITGIAHRLEKELGLNVGPRDCLLIQKRDTTANIGLTDLGRARLAALEVLKEDWDNNPKFLWIHSFPLLCPASPESIAENPLRRFDSMHHPFSAPLDNSGDIFTCPEPLKLRAQHYDLVLNGQEIGGGSVRIHDSDTQERLMRDLLGLSSDQINHFSHLIRALKLGAPPHAGMALGLDRLVAILAGKSSIREVIAFPKNSSGHDLCFKSPS
jgi:aspartyl-tRNA synthetase